MQEKPHVVVTTRTRRAEPASKEFAFTAADMLPGALSQYRQAAWDVYQRIPMPTPSDEAWRRTDLHAFPAAGFRLPSPGEYLDLPPIPSYLLKPVISERHGGQILLMPGGGQVNLDPALKEKGVVFTDLRTAEERYPELLLKLAGQTVRPAEGKFAALTGALAQNGILLYVPKGMVLEDPLHSILWGSGRNLAHITHILIYVDEGASVTYVHESASPEEDGQSLAVGNIEVQVARGANLCFVELQSWGRDTWNFNHERVHVAESGNLDWIFGSIGSHLTKNFMELDLNGEGASGRMSGFYFTNGDQHLDHDTQQNHLAPHTSSDLLFKGALKGRSRSVWQGMIYVAPGAEKTDGYQANRNLILSQEARADSIPGLEILADDIRCTHGATVGQLEQEPLFYLKSRGIPQAEAEHLMVEGFFDPIMQRIPFEGVRSRFQKAIEDKMTSSE